MGEYECWGEDHEDLVEQVRAKVSADPTSTLEALRTVNADAGERDFGAGRSRRWKVIVKCSKGHKNTFEGIGAP